MLTTVDTNILSPEEWHEKSCKYPKTLMRVCGNIDIFDKIGERAQDSVVGYIIDESENNPSILFFLDALKNKGVLTERQLARFNEHVFDMRCKDLIHTRIMTNTLYNNIIRDLKSYNWYTQNPAIQIIDSNGSEQIASLSEEQQIVLGRNVLQSAQGGARSAIDFIRKISTDNKIWPFSFISGIVIEAFVNEKHEIRFKTDLLDAILSILGKLEYSDRDTIINKIILSIKEGCPKEHWTTKADFEEIIGLLLAKGYSWITPLSKSLAEKMNILWPSETA